VKNLIIQNPQTKMTEILADLMMMIAFIITLGEIM